MKSYVSYSWTKRLTCILLCTSVCWYAWDMLFVRILRRKVNVCGGRSVCLPLFLENEKKPVKTYYKVICCFAENYCACEELLLCRHVRTLNCQQAFPFISRTSWLRKQWIIIRFKKLLVGQVIKQLLAMHFSSSCLCVFFTSQTFWFEQFHSFW